MSEQQGTHAPAVCDFWLSSMTGLVAWQWELLQAQNRIGLRLLEAAAGLAASPTQAPAPALAEPPEPDTLGRLERLAAERIGQGLPPPKEIYCYPYRAQIDWTRFPEWARPSDPEMFEGCGHEG
jgi:hypothetical protein